MISDPVKLAIYREALKHDYELFLRYFFKVRNGYKFKLNWHHRVVIDALMRVVSGDCKRLIINIPPGGSKTETAVVSFIPWCLANNPWCRFLHLSYADSLAELNSSSAKEIIETDEYKELFGLEIANDSSAKKRWNVVVDGKKQGGCYATSVGGQVTGFRAGRMEGEFSGVLLLDDPLKPDDAWSKTKRDRANRFINNTIKSRLATSDTPIVLIMQRVHEDDPTGFLLNSASGADWEVVSVPAVIDGKSYWQEKDSIEELLKLKEDDSYTFHSQYMQDPVPVGGGMFKQHWFGQYAPERLSEIVDVCIYADTASKKGQHNDFSVFEVWGSTGNNIMLLDVWRGKWETPELITKAKAIWEKWTGPERIGGVPAASSIKIEDKSSGIGLLQTFKTETNIPAIGIQRNTDKVSRAAACAPYCESGKVLVPESAPWLSSFMGEVCAFSATMAHKHDDQVDPMMDAVEDMLAKPKRRAFFPTR